MGFSILVSCLTLSLIRISQAQYAVITKTVYSTCSMPRSTFPFPSYGWISTNGTTVPYTFGSATTSQANSIDSSYASTRATETSFITTQSHQSMSRSSTVLPMSSATCMSDNGIPISCPRSNGTVFAPSGFCSPTAPNSSYLIMCGQILEGNEVRSRQNIRTAEDCLALCSAESACVALAFNALRHSCSLRSSVTLSTRGLDTDVAFIVDLKYYIELEMQQPPQTMPSTSIPLPPSSYSPSDMGSAASASTHSSNTPTPSQITTPTSDTSSISSAAPVLSPSIYGGSIVTTVFGGTTRTSVSNGEPTAVVTGGLTTTYTSGGTTTFVTVTAIATSNPSAVADAEIGLCPAYSGKVYEASGEALLVGCGVVYIGTVISSNNRREVNKRATANDCSLQCRATADCVAMTFTRNACTLYSMVEGQRTALVPAFSAVRLVLDDPNAGNPSSAQVSGTIIGTSANTNAQVTGISQPLVTTTQMSTIVSVSTSTVVLQIPPSTFTQVIPASTITVVSSAPGQTTTAVHTSVQPPVTTTVVLSTTQLVTYTTTGPISTLISTIVNILSQAPSTQIVTTTRDQSTLFYTTTIVSVLPASTMVSTHLATTTQQGTAAVSTERITLTASASTITVTTTLPIYVLSTVISTPPAETVVSLQTVTSTIPASTLTIESISTVLLTSTALGEITTAVFTSLVTESVTTTFPASTITFVISVTETLHTTAVSTSISVPEASIITTTYATTFPAETFTEPTTIVSTQPASTITETLETTLPDITLTQPTTIVSTQLASTLTITREITPPAETLTQPLTIISTQLASTITTTRETTFPAATNREPTTIVSTQLASTLTTTEISTPPSVTLTQPTTIYSIVVSSVPVTYTTSYVETSISVSTAPGSTITTTATSLVHSTLVSTMNVTQTTSRVETRTEVTTQPATTIVSTQYVEGPRPIPTCLSSNNGQTYTASDGSQYMILCGQSNTGYDLYGVSVSANSYSSCVERCSAQGTTCNGITWQASSSTCTLKKRMIPASASQMGASSDTDCALRLTGPTGSGARTQLVSNGGFDTGDFSSWALNTYPGVSASVVDNVATFGINGDFWYAYVVQSITQAAGINYMISFNVGITGSGAGYCDFRPSSDGDDMKRFTSYPLIQPMTSVYASGILRYDMTQFAMLGECSNAGRTITFDDIAFYSYPSSPGYDPTPVIPVVIIAGASYSYFNSAFQQYNIPTILEAQTFTLTADLQFAIPGGTTCTLQLGFYMNPFFGSNCDMFESQPGGIYCQIFSMSGSFPIAVYSEAQYSYGSLNVMFYCSGSSGSALTINNLYLTVNT